MRKLIKPAAIGPEVIDAIKRDRVFLALNELVFKYSISYQNIALICKGIERQKIRDSYKHESLCS